MKQRLAGILRMLGLDRNPLRRRIDRIEVALLAGLVTVALIAAPLAAVFAARIADGAGLREQRAERSWREVMAVLQQDASAGVIGLDGEWDTAWVLARWPVPGHGERTGLVATELDARAGQNVPVWITSSGQLTSPPLSANDLAERSALAAFTATLIVAALAAVGAAVVRASAARHRMARWTRAWEATGPKWSRLG